MGVSILPVFVGTADRAVISRETVERHGYLAMQASQADSSPSRCRALPAAVTITVVCFTGGTGHAWPLTLTGLREALVGEAAVDISTTFGREPLFMTGIGFQEAGTLSYMCPVYSYYCLYF